MEDDTILLAAGYIATAVSAAANAINHTDMLRAPLLPHYKQKYILEQIGVLTLPYVPSTTAQRQIDNAVQRFSSESPPPSAFLLLSRNHKRFERLTRFSVAEFITLYLELEPYIRRPYAIYSQTAQSHRKRRPHPFFNMQSDRINWRKPRPDHSQRVPYNMGTSTDCMLDKENFHDSTDRFASHCRDGHPRRLQHDGRRRAGYFEGWRRHHELG